MAGLGAPCSAKSVDVFTLVPNDQMPPPILLITRFVMGSAERTFLPVRHYHQAVFLQALIMEEAQHRARAFFTEHEVIVIRAALIAVPFDHKLILGICL